MAKDHVWVWGPTTEVYVDAHVPWSHERFRVWVSTWGLVGVQGPDWSRFSGLLFGARMLKLCCCCLRSCLGQLPSCSQGLWWSLWSSLPLGLIQRPGIWVEYRDSVGVWGPCHSRGHTDIGELYSHPTSWCHLGPSCSRGPCLGVWPYSSQSLKWLLGVLLPPNTIRMPRVRSATWAKVGVWGKGCFHIWVTCSCSSMSWCHPRQSRSWGPCQDPWHCFR